MFLYVKNGEMYISSLWEGIPFRKGVFLRRISSLVLHIQKRDQYWPLFLEVALNEPLPLLIKILALLQ